MSNSIAPGSSADVNVKVTALTTNPNVPVTYKTVILKKNLVNGVNTLTQEMMSDENIKYVIKYDYVLGEDITVPENCILEFDGGSLSNGNINLNNCDIIAPLKPIFKGARLSANYNKEVKAEWFNILPGTTVDNQTIANLIKYVVCVVFGYGEFTFYQTVNVATNYSDASLNDNCKIIKGSLSEYNGGPSERTKFIFDGCDGINTSAGGNLTVKDLEIVGRNAYGEWDNNSKTYLNSKCCFKLKAGAFIKNVRLGNFGYGIYNNGGNIVKLQVINCTIGGCSNNGIDLSSAVSGSINAVVIANCYFVNNGHEHGDRAADSTEVYSGHGLHIGDGNGYYIAGNVFEYNSGCGIYFSMTQNKRIYASVIGNTFERNKYTQICMQTPRNYDTIFVKGNAYSDATYPVVSNGLPQREVCAIVNGQLILSNRNITLEDFNYIDWLSIPKSNAKEYVYNRLANPMWYKEGNDNVFKCYIAANDNVPTGFKAWKITKSGWYRLSFTAKVDTGTTQITALALSRNGERQSNNTITFNSTEYATKYTPYVWFNEGDYATIAPSSYWRLPTSTYIIVKDYELEEANFVGTTSERPYFTTGTGLGHQYYDETLGKPIYWNGSAWVDATGTPV